MTKCVSVAQAKAQLSALMAAVVYGGDRYVIERHGKPTAALVSIDDLKRLEQDRMDAAPPKGALALAGAWADLLTDAEIDQFVAEVYAEREQDTGRPVNLEV